jgi:hypothetical protein
MRAAVVLFLLGASVLSRPAAAEPLTFTFHDFDDRQPGIQSYFERGLFLGSVIQDRIFDAVEIVPTPTFGSPPHAVRPVTSSEALTGIFRDETPHFTPAVRVLFVEVFGIQPGDPPSRLAVLDRAGRTILEVALAISQGLGVARSTPEIASFIFTPGTSSHVLDNVRHTAPVVPEPTTIVLMGSGVALAAWRRRRARASVAAPHHEPHH